MLNTNVYTTYIYVCVHCVICVQVLLCVRDGGDTGQDFNGVSIVM